jgi:WD40 repeat protein
MTGKTWAAMLLAGLVITAAGLAATQAPAEPPKRTSGTLTKATSAVKLDHYGDPLPPDARARLGTIRFRNADGIGAHGLGSLSYTADGRFLLSGGAGGARVWDAATGKQVAHFGRDLPSPHGRASVSPDGKLIAVGGWGEDMGGAVYEVATGRQLYRFGSPSIIAMGNFSPDGKTLAVYPRNDGAIVLHDVATGKELRALERHSADGEGFHLVESALFTADSKKLVSAGRDKTVRLWDVTTGKELKRIKTQGDGISSMALSADGSLVATVAYKKLDRKEDGSSLFPDHRIQLWDLGSGKKVRELVPHTAQSEDAHPPGPDCLTFSPDGKTLLSGGHGRVVQVWDPVAGKELRRFNDPWGWVTAVTIAPDGKTFAVTDTAHTVRVRDLASGADVVPTHAGHRAPVITTAISAQRRMIATGGEDRKIYLWDLATGKPLRRLDAHDDSVPFLAFSPDGRTLFSAAYDKTFRAWDPEKGRQLYRLEGPAFYTRLLALSPDGKLLASGGEDNKIKLFNTQAGTALDPLEHRVKDIAGLTFTPDGHALLAWSSDQTLHRWDLATGKHSRRPCSGLKESAWVVAFSADRRLAAFAGQADHLAVVDLTTGRELRRFPNRSAEYEDAIHALAFSPDGRTLAWGGPSDNLICLAEIATGNVRYNLAGHHGRVQSLVFSADGKSLISGGADTTALVWDLTAPLASEAATRLSDAALLRYWNQLAADDAKSAYRALRHLIADADGSVPYLGKQLRPVQPPDPRRIARLLTDLGSQRFTTRQEAAHELDSLGDVTLPFLRKALAEKQPLETRRRLEGLVKQLEAASGERLQALRAVEALEYMASPEALQVLQRLAHGAPEARLTQQVRASLKRLTGEQNK